MSVTYQITIACDRCGAAAHVTRTEFEPPMLAQGIRAHVRAMGWQTSTVRTPDQADLCPDCHIQAMIADAAAFQETVTPDELDEFERELEADRRRRRGGGGQ